MAIANALQLEVTRMPH